MGFIGFWGSSFIPGFGYRGIKVGIARADKIKEGLQCGARLLKQTNPQNQYALTTIRQSSIIITAILVIIKSPHFEVINYQRGSTLFGEPQEGFYNTST